MLPFASVGATENLLMAATLAAGRTEIVNAAREPEIGDLVACLVAMGAEIADQGSGTLVIDGVPRLHGARHAVVSDRIECGTYACAVAIAGGDVRLLGGRIGHLGAVVRVLEEAGIEVAQEEGAIRVRRAGALAGVDVMTEPYPGFPTDMQAQFMALFSVADGASMMTETIFENRFMHVQELNRMGARINVHGASAIVRVVSVDPQGRAGDGDGSAGLSVAHPRRARRRRARPMRQPGVPPRPGVRVARAEARGLRCGHRTVEVVGLVQKART